MGMIKLTREGSWWLRSKTDPRWNSDGRGLVGGFQCGEASAMIEKLKEILGDPPKDLEMGGMKD
jgi:hypothetical protein